jgi:hypothetical protein
VTRKKEPASPGKRALSRGFGGKTPIDDAQNRRASPEAVEKRRAARLFNQALLGDAGGGAPDGRTERRRRRLLDELARGAARGGKRALKPIDVLSRVQELLSLGEPLASIRKACPRPRPVEATPEIVEGIRRIHRAYEFPIEAYAFVGLDAEALRRAGILPDPEGPAHPGLRSTRPRRRLTRAAARG